MPDNRPFIQHHILLPVENGKVGWELIKPKEPAQWQQLAKPGVVQPSGKPTETEGIKWPTNSTGQSSTKMATWTLEPNERVIRAIAWAYAKAEAGKPYKLSLLQNGTQKAFMEVTGAVAWWSAEWVFPITGPELATLFIAATSTGVATTAGDVFCWYIDLETEQEAPLPPRPRRIDFRRQPRYRVKPPEPVRNMGLAVGNVRAGATSTEAALLAGTAVDRNAAGATTTDVALETAKVLGRLSDGAIASSIDIRVPQETGQVRAGATARSTDVHLAQDTGQVAAGARASDVTVREAVVTESTTAGATTSSTAAQQADITGRVLAGVPGAVLRRSAGPPVLEVRFPRNVVIKEGVTYGSTAAGSRISSTETIKSGTVARIFAGTTVTAASRITADTTSAVAAGAASEAVMYRVASSQVSMTVGATMVAIIPTATADNIVMIM